MKLVENEFIKFMEKFDENPFRIILEDGEHTIGEGEPAFTVKINKVPKMTDMLTSTSITLGEAYMNGDIEIEGDLYTALNMFLGQMGKFSTDKKKLKNIIFTSKSKANQKKEVSSHYDIGNDFYKMWLDETLSYSCGYFKNDNDTLYQAQCNKVDRILEKLNLSENMTLCDIGCGWGFLLIEAAKKYKINGVGITLSKEQKAKFEQRIKDEGLSERLEVKLLDYRDLPKLNKKFDRVVSVGMIEHVGRGNYEEFMQCVKSVLKPGGIFVLHFISSLKEYPGDAWVKNISSRAELFQVSERLFRLQESRDFILLMLRVLEDIITEHFSAGMKIFKSTEQKLLKCLTKSLQECGNFIFVLVPQPL